MLRVVFHLCDGKEGPVAKGRGDNGAGAGISNQASAVSVCTMALLLLSQMLSGSAVFWLLQTKQTFIDVIFVFQEFCSYFKCSYHLQNIQQHGIFKIGQLGDAWNFFTNKLNNSNSFCAMKKLGRTLIFEAKKVEKKFRASLKLTDIKNLKER